LEALLTFSSVELRRVEGYPSVVGLIEWSREAFPAPASRLRERKNKSQIFFERKKIPARARVLGSPTIARAKFLARAFAQIPMICYARYLLQTYPSSSVPFFKQMYVLLVTNLCSKACKTLGFFFCLFGGAKGSWAAGEKLSKFGEKAKKKERERGCDQRVEFVFLCQKLQYDYIFQNSLNRISTVRSSSSCSSSCR
jgi:hypothetical protein